MASKKTVLRSIRITEELDEILRKDAEARGFSVNAFLASILQRYTDWDRYADRFGFVTITRNGYRDLIQMIRDEDLAALGSKLGAHNPREMTLFWFKRLNLDTFLRYLSLVSRYARTLQHDVAMDGRDIVLTLQLETPKDVVFTASFIDQAIREIVGVVPKVTAGRTSIVARFPKPAVG